MIRQCIQRYLLYYASEALLCLKFTCPELCNAHSCCLFYACRWHNLLKLDWFIPCVTETCSAILIEPLFHACNAWLIYVVPTSKLCSVHWASYIQSLHNFPSAFSCLWLFTRFRATLWPHLLLTIANGCYRGAWNMQEELVHIIRSTETAAEDDRERNPATSAHKLITTALIKQVTCFSVASMHVWMLSHHACYGINWMHTFCAHVTC